ncbi:polyphosphate kinase 1 [Aureibacter tunicatorum]|uniref:Polyphosphate kinase n=1 Tax=Aureibacter tunicatorum TaxID=866807 RepID=A0AAE4BSA6_9BACT|nr:polyphosphate kinase 1 [Aureibacter tunicatorum]MDR6239561.1 polyphosphate kinase [Aureibacter tunicatorum]BDD04038.1 RNA degradosome polyphosphate kinase [Aureibacter tunicatorum]
MIDQENIQNIIQKSDLISRDLSWLKFNDRVLDQAAQKDRSITERLKFLAITASNLDEFFMIRVGSLYNYLDFEKERLDYSGLDEQTFKTTLFEEVRRFNNDQAKLFKNFLPLFKKNDFDIVKDLSKLQKSELEEIKDYFKMTIFPMITPMVYDPYHTFPILMNQVLIFGVVTINDKVEDIEKVNFVQIPKNLPKFYVVERSNQTIFVPIEEIIRKYIGKFFRNIKISSASLFRITRNGDFTLEESDDIDVNFLDELKAKLKTRKTGRVVRVEIEPDIDPFLKQILTEKFAIDEDNFVTVGKEDILDYTRLWQIVKYPKLRSLSPKLKKPVPPLSLPENKTNDIFSVLKKHDIFLHHPYNSIDPVTEMLEKAASDPQVLSIKMTIYRLAQNSRVTSALLKAVENGKNVSVLFEVKARFDEENNLKEAKRLQEAGCFVIYGISHFKTHTKLLLIVRKEANNKISRYVHMGSGNYNEDTSKLYTDLGLLTSNEIYGKDVSEFFNVITGHSAPNYYENLITAPGGMRNKLIDLIKKESDNAKNGKPSGIVLKINSLQDKELIKELYKASQAGVVIKLIVRGICCIRPQRKGLSENIHVRSIVGNYLEHSRIFYFHNEGSPIVYGGSADVMVRSFDRRLESLFKFVDPLATQEVITILAYNLLDNVNAYEMKEDGSYESCKNNGPKFDLHKELFKLNKEIVSKTQLF